MSGWLSRYKREFSVLIAYAVILLLLLAITPVFFKSEFEDTCVSAAPMLVVAVGMTMVIIARHIDISVGWQFSICAVVGGMAAKAGCPMPVVSVIAMLAGAVLGAFNGVLVAFMGLPSIVVTLATMVIFREGLLWQTQGVSVQVPAGFQWFGHDQHVGQILVIVSAVVIFLIFAWALGWLSGGRYVYAVGSDEEAARLAGIQPRKVVLSVFILMGVLTGVAALLQSVRFADVDPKVGDGLELQVIAAVVVGGTAISGGRGTLFGTLVGVALLGSVSAALAFLTKAPQWDQAIQGVIILAAVASDGLSRRARRA